MSVLNRMKADGSRAWQELVPNLVHWARERAHTQAMVESWASFTNRDQACSAVADIDERLNIMRRLAYALIAENGTSTGRVLAATGGGQLDAQELGLGWSELSALPPPLPIGFATLPTSSVVAARTNPWPAGRVIRLVLAIVLIVIDVMAIGLALVAWYLPHIWLIPGFVTLLAWLTWPKASNHV